MTKILFVCHGSIAESPEKTDIPMVLRLELTATTP